LSEEGRRLYKQAYQKAYRELNEDRLRRQRRRYYQEHKEKCRRESREYYRKHTERIKADAIRTGKKLRVKQRMVVLFHYSNGTMACVRCGYSDIRALVLDHINGGGTEQRRKMGTGIHVWLWLARHGFPPGYQILCANCNTIKAREENEYGSNSLIGTDWRSRFDWKEQLRELALPERGRAWELPLNVKQDVRRVLDGEAL